jgi:hypothetical protein
MALVVLAVVHMAVERIMTRITHWPMHVMGAMEGLGKPQRPLDAALERLHARLVAMRAAARTLCGVNKHTASPYTHACCRKQSRAGDRQCMVHSAPSWCGQHCGDVLLARSVCTDAQC